MESAESFSYITCQENAPHCRAMDRRQKSVYICRTSINRLPDSEGINGVLFFHCLPKASVGLTGVPVTVVLFVGCCGVPCVCVSFDIDTNSTTHLRPIMLRK